MAEFIEVVLALIAIRVALDAFSYIRWRSRRRGRRLGYIQFKPKRDR